MADGSFEMVIEGPFALVKGFIEGVLAARDRAGRAVYERETAAGGHARERFLEWLALKEPSTRVVVDEQDIAPLEQAFDRGRSAVGLRIVQKRRVASACFQFEFKTFSQEQGREVSGLLASPPAGVEVRHFKAEEDVDEDARGPESYAPMHDYVFKGSGNVQGPFEGVCAVRRALDKLEPLKLGPLDLVFDDRSET